MLLSVALSSNGYIRTFFLQISQNLFRFKFKSKFLWFAVKNNSKGYILPMKDIRHVKINVLLYQVVDICEVPPEEEM